MRQSFLLDTSAFRSLSGKTLEEVSQNHSLYTSSYCFWELLTHLDEHKNFERAEGQFIKFKHVQVLDDPYAAVQTPLLREDLELQSRSSDDELIYAFLAAFRDSASLEELYSTRLEDSKSRQYEVSDCVARGQDVLYKEEKKYVESVTSILKLIKSGQVRYETNEDCHEVVLSLVGGWVRGFQQRGASDTELRERLTTDTYVYFSYLFHRALDYLKRKANLDPNDYEDAALCLHLKLDDTPYCVVTGDQDLRAILTETTSLLSGLNQPRFRTSLQVIDVAGIQKLS